MSATIFLVNCAGGQMQADTKEINVQHETIPSGVDPEKYQDIELLIEMTGGKEVLKRVNETFQDSFANFIKKDNPNIDERIVDIMKEEIVNVMNENIDFFLASQAKSYNKYFTHVEIKELIQFYQSEVGRKFIQIYPSLIQDIMNEAQIFSVYLQPKIEERVRKRLEKEGVDIGI
jgi:hypothetical protein